MDRATLWMPPLYFLILSIPLSIFEDPLMTGRLFSLFLGLINIVLFYLLICEISKSKKIALFLSFLLVINLSFIRAGNIIRMELLNLSFIFLTLLFLEKKNKWLTSIFLALAGLTHPISIFLVPIVFIYEFKNWKNIFIIGFISFSLFVPWLIYVIYNYDIFVFQFLSQFSRKSAHYDYQSIIYLLKVIGMQYGSQIIFILVYLFIIFINLFYLYKWKYLHGKYFIISNMVFVIVFFSSEMWYSIYIYPFYFINLAVILRSEKKYKNQIIYGVLGLFLSIKIIFFINQFFERENFTKEYNAYIFFLETHLSDCQTVFLQSIPDPYFHLSKNKTYKEFPPYGLLKYSYKWDEIRKNNYKQIDCFVISNNERKEKILEEILSEGKFETIHFPQFRFISSGKIYKRSL